jgi:hypothetical protein
VRSEEVAAYLERHATTRHATPKPAAGGPEGTGRARGITCGAGTLEVRHLGSTSGRSTSRRRGCRSGRRSTSSFASAAWRAITCTCGADGVHFNVRLSDERLCTLVLIGACADGQKELIAVEDGDRESAETLNTVLRHLKRRGMQAPVSAVGDAAPSGRRCGRFMACDARTTRWVPRDAQVLDSCQACKAMRSPDHASSTTALDNISNLCKDHANTIAIKSLSRYATEIRHYTRLQE